LPAISAALQETACIEGKPLKVDTVLELGIQIADALDAAHSKGINPPRYQTRVRLRDARNQEQRFEITYWDEPTKLKATQGAAAF
jgi:hypothetical protein